MVLGIAGAFWIVIQFRLVFFSLFVAIVISTAIEPLITRLNRLGISRALSMILVSLLVLLVVFGLIVTVVPLVSAQWTTISSLVSQSYLSLRDALVNSNSVLFHRIVQELPASLPTVSSVPVSPSQDNPLGFAQQAFTLGSSIFHSLVLIISILLLTGLWVVEGEITTRLLLMIVPASHRDKVRLFWDEMQQKVGAYTRGLVLLLGLMGGLAAIAYTLIGLPNVLLLGLIAGLMEIVPLIGPALGAVPAVLVASATDPSKVIWVIAAYLIIQIVESNFIVPRVMDRAVGVNPVASLLAFVAFGAIFGFIGAVLAVPLAAVVQLILNRFIFNTNPAEQIPPTGRSAISTLRYEAQNLVLDVRKQIRDKQADVTEMEDQMEDELETIAMDLDSILAQTEIDAQGKPQQASGSIAQ
jgi:predicted PurR-regulated permease PerM